MLAGEDAGWVSSRLGSLELFELRRLECSEVWRVSSGVPYKVCPGRKSSSLIFIGKGVLIS